MGIFKKFVAKNGKEIILRGPKKNDLRGYLNYINSLVAEDAQILENKKKTLEDEKKFIKEILDGVKRNERVVVVAEADGKLVGNADIRKGRGRSSHIGEFGIGVMRGCRRIGIGEELTKTAIELAKKRLRIEAVDLGVFDTNKNAKRLYRKLGFRVIARIPKNLRYRGRDTDHVIMRLRL